MSNSYTIEKYKEAGKIASKIKRKILPNVVKVGTSLKEVCEVIEKYIIEQGAIPAFPVNIGINEIAAHFTPSLTSKEILPPDSIVKIDFGVSIDGYIVDTAISFPLGKEFKRIVETNRMALNRGISAIRAGSSFNSYAKCVSQEITEKGFKVIQNLTGHRIERFTLHTGDSIPNVPEWTNRGSFRAYNVYALEPFATYSEAAGYVVERNDSYIFRIKGLKPPVKYRKSWLILYRKFNGLPFAIRWLSSSERRYFKDLIEINLVHSYPVLIEASNKPVSQAEETILVLPEKVVILTK